MKIAMCFLLVCGLLSSFAMAFDMAKLNKTFLITNKANEIFLKRQKRYLVFEKGSAVTANMAKSIISGIPRGLNEIAEYTLMYNLPVDNQLFYRNNKVTTTTTRKSITRTTGVPYHPSLYSYNDVYNWNNDGFHTNLRQRNYSKGKHSNCYKKHYYDYSKKISKICLKRTKRNFAMTELNTSQRMFYDLMEKWSLIHGFSPRYCFMRTLCESSHLLLPNGYSLLHDIIQILLRYTKPWAFHHEIFGRSLRQQHRIDECAKLYGPYCRVSWLHFITKVVHGSRTADFMR